MGKASEKSPIFSAKGWVEVNDDRRQNYDSNLVEIKRSIFLRLFDYISAYILVKGRVTDVGTGIITKNMYK